MVQGFYRLQYRLWQALTALVAFQGLFGLSAGFRRFTQIYAGLENMQAGRQISAGLSGFIVLRRSTQAHAGFMQALNICRPARLLNHRPSQPADI